MTRIVEAPITLPRDSAVQMLSYLSGLLSSMGEAGATYAPATMLALGQQIDAYLDSRLERLAKGEPAP